RRLGRYRRGGPARAARAEYQPPRDRVRRQRDGRGDALRVGARPHAPARRERRSEGRDPPSHDGLRRADGGRLHRALGADAAGRLGRLRAAARAQTHGAGRRDGRARLRTGQRGDVRGRVRRAEEAGKERVTTMSPAIETAGLSKTFGETRALNGVDLFVRRGMVYGLLGPNGAGKTTMIRILATLIRPGGGSARVLGHDIVKEAAAVRAKVSLTGQFASVDEDLTGHENLVLVARLLGFSWRDAKARA